MRRWVVWVSRHRGEPVGGGEDDGGVWHHHSGLPCDEEPNSAEGGAAERPEQRALWGMAVAGSGKAEPSPEAEQVIAQPSHADIAAVTHAGGVQGGEVGFVTFDKQQTVALHQGFAGFGGMSHFAQNFGELCVGLGVEGVVEAAATGEPFFSGSEGEG